MRLFWFVKREMVRLHTFQTQSQCTTLHPLFLAKTKWTLHVYSPNCYRKWIRQIRARHFSFICLNFSQMCTLELVRWCFGMLSGWSPGLLWGEAIQVTGFSGSLVARNVTNRIWRENAQGACARKMARVVKKFCKVFATENSVNMCFSSTCLLCKEQWKCLKLVEE